MKRNPDFEGNRYLAVGVSLNAVYMSATHLVEAQHPLALFLLGLMEGLAIGLMGLGLLRATPRGRAFLERVCRFKRSLFGKGGA